MAVNDPFNVLPIIVGTAQKYGINPLVAIATAIVESGLNPKAIGDNGTSFGLYQLHEGGELGNLTEHQAFDPATNADRALSTMAQFQKQNPSLSGGSLAAAAQRPANQSAYAAKINSVMQEIGGVNVVAGGGPGNAGGATSTNDANTVTDAKTAYQKAQSTGASGAVQHSLISGGLDALPFIGGPLGIVANYFTGAGSMEKLFTEAPKVLTDAFSLEEDLLWPFADNHMFRLMLGIIAVGLMLAGVTFIIMEVH